MNTKYNKPSSINITETSWALFMAYVEDASNWSGTPLVGGNIGGDSKAQRGNITQLKKAGLISTTEDAGDAFVIFTEKAERIASSFNILLGGYKGQAGWGENADVDENEAPVAADEKEVAKVTSESIDVAVDKKDRKLTFKGGKFRYMGKVHQQEDRVYPEKPEEGRWNWKVTADEMKEAITAAKV